VFSRFLFNDAEVKPFDPCQIASECFGGEMTVSHAHKMDLQLLKISLFNNHKCYMYDFCPSLEIGCEWEGLRKKISSEKKHLLLHLSNSAPKSLLYV
jgi:hypothetical protein